MRTKRFTAIALLFLGVLVLAASSAGAKMLKNGIRLRNPTAGAATVTYSWSGHFAGGGEV